MLHWNKMQMLLFSILNISPFCAACRAHRDTSVGKTQVNKSPTINSPTFESRSEKRWEQLQPLKPDYVTCTLPSSFYLSKDNDSSETEKGGVWTASACIIVNLGNPEHFLLGNIIIFYSFAFLEWKCSTHHKKLHQCKPHFGFNKIKM